MRILVNTRFLIKDRLEGIGLYSFEVLSRLVKSHPQHDFIFAFDRSFDDSFVFGSNVTPIVLQPPARHPVLFWWWFEVAIPRAYRRHRCHAFFSPDGFTSLHRAIDHNVITVHDVAYLHYPQQIGPVMLQYYRKFMPRFMARANSIITVSRTSRDDIARHFPAAKDKLSWVYNGSRPGYQEATSQQVKAVRARWSDGYPYFIAVGAIHPRKNITNVVRAFEAYRAATKHQTRLILVGRHAWKSSVVGKMLDNSPVSSSIVSTGYVDDDTLVDLLSSAMALVYVSLLEGFGLPIVDAMACGVPVIASNRSSMREIAEGFSLQVDPEDSEAIAQAMRKVAEEEELRRRLRTEGLQRSTSFSWDKATAHVATKLLD